MLCKHGQLTETGIRQHLTLGEHMRQVRNTTLASCVNHRWLTDGLFSHIGDLMLILAVTDRR